ncbi:MAG: DUF3365 domain-containing protein [Halieaceae bacterium]|jgi:hypothetical protein|nr:DUF3365 domain-containing protein [Halieaceae bacterium]
MKSMLQHILGRKTALICSTMALFFATVIAVVPTAYADDKAASADEITVLFRAARTVISKNQGLINEQGTGKILTADYVVGEAKSNFKKSSGHDLDLANDPLGAKAAMLSAVAKVMDNAQPLINDPDKGFKGFLPAIFARLVATSFGKETGGKMKIKLTAPKKYVRNRGNRPDSWESNVIDTMFSASGYEKGKPFFENADIKGKPAFRYILPEYYGESCLGCHGGPAGEKDITGGKKEGGKLGELGGAISLAIFD